MTDAELRDAGVAALKRTTVSYPEWLKRVNAGRYTPRDGSGTEWGKAFASLALIETATPTPPPTTAVLEIAGGTYTGREYAALLAATSGPLTVRPKPGAVVTVLGGASVRNDLVTEGIRFDGQAKTPNTWMTDVSRWAFRNCSFERFYVAADPSAHCEALYVGGGCRDGVIEGCSFNDNGNTAHIFFTWFGSSQGGGAYDTGNYPRNICVRANTFGPRHGAYFDVDFRSEIPLEANIKIQRDASCTSPEFYGDC